MHLVDEQAILPVLVVDEAQYLSDRFLADLSGFLNFAFDSRDLFPMWLVGMPALASHLRMQKHAALAMRVAVHVHLEPLERDDFFGLLEHGLDAAGAKSKLLNEPAREMILRASHGLPRVASRLLRTALREAQHRGQDFVDEPDGPRDRGAPVSAPAPLPVARIAELRPPERGRRWLVDGLWSRAAVGIIGGAPKCHKSWLALDLAVSVASDTVPRRLRRHRGRPCPALHGRGRRRDGLLLLDPFVRLHRLDENDAGHISGLLAYLRELQREHDLAVVVVHHTRKNGGVGAAGQNLRGSGDFHAWVDSSLYLRKKRDQLWLAVEHRAARAIDPVALHLVGDDDPGDLHLELVDAEDARAERDLPAAVLRALAEQPRTRTDLRVHLAVRNERLGDALAQLRDDGRVERRNGLWRLVPHSAP